jgi:hypothetical protein
MNVCPIWSVHTSVPLNNVMRKTKVPCRMSTGSLGKYRLSQNSSLLTFTNKWSISFISFILVYYFRDTLLSFDVHFKLKILPWPRRMDITYYTLECNLKYILRTNGLTYQSRTTDFNLKNKLVQWKIENNTFIDKTHEKVNIVCSHLLVDFVHRYVLQTKIKTFLFEDRIRPFDIIVGFLTQDYGHFP